MYTVAESDGSVTLSVELIIGSVDRDVVLVLFGSDDTALGDRNTQASIDY